MIFYSLGTVGLKGWFDTTGCFALKKMAHGPNKEIGGLGAGPQRYKAAGGENFGLFEAFLLGYVLGIRTGLGSQPAILLFMKQISLLINA